jgi:exodeoxyribonuclease VII small subunit
MENLTFEEALAELERIVRELEDGKIGLEESLTRYEQGVGILRRCYGQLRQAEQRIVELMGMDGEGKAVTRPFEHVAKVSTIKNETG